MQLIKSDKFKKVLYIILTLLWMGFIFYNSAQNGLKSSGMSDKVLDIAQQVLDNLFGISDDFKDFIQNDSGIIIRKTAHFFEYFVLYILVYFSIGSFVKQRKKAVLYSIIFCIMYAASDEIHQLFVPGRAGMVKDVIIDSTGVLTSALLIKGTKSERAY